MASKGTGRARQGSIRSPQWRGGEIVFGPTQVAMRVQNPPRVRRLALKLFTQKKLLKQICSC